MPDIHVTVATVVHCQDHFLLVREYNADHQICYNQPAGHLESGETLTEGARRELLEETGLTLPITGWLGLYPYQPTHESDSFIRITFIAQAPGLLDTRPQDPDIIDCLWATSEQILTLSPQFRSPLVLRCIQDYHRGKHLDLQTIHPLITGQ